MLVSSKVHSLSEWLVLQPTTRLVRLRGRWCGDGRMRREVWYLIVSNVSAETGSEVNAVNQDTSVKPIWDQASYRTQPIYEQSRSPRDNAGIWPVESRFRLRNGVELYTAVEIDVIASECLYGAGLIAGFTSVILEPRAWRDAKYSNGPSSPERTPKRWRAGENPTRAYESKSSSEAQALAEEQCLYILKKNRIWTSKSFVYIVKV